MPVPNALESASLAAKRAAKWRAGNFIDCEYDNLAFGKNAFEKAVAETLDRILDPDAIHQVDTNADNAHPAVILHRFEHLAHRDLDPDEDRAGDNRMPDVQLYEMRDFVDESDIAIIDAMAGVDLEAKTCRLDRRFPQSLQFLLFDLFRKRIGQSAGVQFHHVRLQFNRPRRPVPAPDR